MYDDTPIGAPGWTRHPEENPPSNTPVKNLFKPIGTKPDCFGKFTSCPCTDKCLIADDCKAKKVKKL